MIFKVNFENNRMMYENGLDYSTMNSLFNILRKHFNYIRETSESFENSRMHVFFSKHYGAAINNNNCVMLQ